MFLGGLVYWTIVLYVVPCYVSKSLTLDCRLLDFEVLAKLTRPKHPPPFTRSPEKEDEDVKHERDIVLTQPSHGIYIIGWLTRYLLSNY